MRVRPILLALMTLQLTACASGGGHPEPTAPVNTGSVKPGTSVNQGGKAVALAKGHLELNQPLPAVALTDTQWQSYTLKADGKVKLVSIVPSVDTKVCEQQTHILGDTSKLSAKVERITVSRDLPAAQRRFAAEAKLTNITYLSDYKAGSFGREAGLLMEESGLLARAVAVVDGKGNVRYLQVVPEEGNLPDMNRAIDVANELAK